jgi:hypothetical protein
MGVAGQVWGALGLCVLATVVLDFTLMSALADFGADSQTPLDLCSQLNGRMLPYLVLKTSICLLSIWEFKRGWPLLIAHGLALAYFLWRMRIFDRNRRTRGNCKAYEPLTIVRDLDRLMAIHVAIAIVDCLSVVYTIVRSLFVWFG